MRSADSKNGVAAGSVEEPSPIHWRLGILLILFCEFCLVYGVADYLARQTGPRLLTPVGMERSIPFVPQFTVWYFSLYPLMWCCFYFYTTKSELIWLFKKFSLELLLAGAVFLTVPTIVPYYGWDGEGITAWLYRLADTMNLEANSFPSLHVAFAVTSAELCAARAGPVARGAFVLWAALVAISTLLTKQHVLIDLLGGLFLAWIVSRIRRE